MNHFERSLYCLTVTGAIMSFFAAFGQLSASYTVDTNTVYLFHLNESAASNTAINSVPSGHSGVTTNGSGTTVTDVLAGASGYFGSAASFSLDRAIGIDADGSGSFTTAGADRFNLSQLVGVDNAFTLEALVKPETADFDSNGQIWCADSSATRGFQFRINSSEELQYNGLAFGGGNESIQLTDLQSGSWYHAALTYTEAGQPAGTGLFTMYWTPLTELSNVAEVVHSWSSPAITPNFSSQLLLGNEGRGAMGEGFLGLIDEARISSVVRAADEFLLSAPDLNANVNSDSDSDGLPDDWERAHFGDLSQAGHDNPDGDSFDNSSEQAANTDPNNDVTYPGTVDPTTPTGLMVDLLAHPHRTTIPDTEPEFVWIFHPAARGDNQTAYQIIVSSTAALARVGTGDVWDSGKVTSGESVNVAYAGGSELARGNGYFWRVRTWGAANTASDWSFVQSFNMESSTPQSGAGSIHLSSTSDANGYDWAGRYQPQFNTAVTPVQVVDKGNGNFFIDFGKDAFGYVTLQLDGDFAGQSMEVRFGEKAQGTSVDTSPGATIRYSTTTEPLSDGDVNYEIRPPVTVYNSSKGQLTIDGWAGAVTPFRYIELLDCPATVTADDIQQWVLHTPFDENAASFTSSNSTLNSVWDLCHYSMKVTTFCGVYVDGDRERRPYEADAYLNQISHYAVDREYTIGRYTYEWLLDNSTWPTEWKMHFPLMAWADYMHTGNKEALAANYDKILGHIDQYSGGLTNGLLNTGDERDIVDWPNGERDNYSFSDVNTVVNAFNYKSWDLLAKMAEVLGNTTDLNTFTTRLNDIETAFNATFWNGSQYQDGQTATHVSAHANFFPMAMGLVPTDRVASVMTFLKTKRMAPSVYGAQYLLEALFDGGESDYAIGLMADNDPTYQRHWYNMLREGSTITMEAWDDSYKSNTDWNHAWGAAPANIIPRYVLGLKPMIAGFGQVEIKPQLGTGDRTNGLTSATGIIPTIRGSVGIEVENTSASFKMQVQIPGNMTARILVPTKGYTNATLLVNGAVVAAPVVDGRLELDGVQSGTHIIWLSETATPDEATLKENWKASMFGDDASNSAIFDDTLDPDMDGETNLQEFYANTNPLDDTDRFAVLSYQMNEPAGAFEMTVAGKVGRRYILQRNIDLDPLTWLPVDSLSVPVVESVLTLNDSTIPDSDHVFYRAVAELP